MNEIEKAINYFKSEIDFAYEQNNVHALKNVSVFNTGIQALEEKLEREKGISDERNFIQGEKFKFRRMG